MKNKQKGFIVPLIIIIAAAFAIGGGVYVHQKNKVSMQGHTNINLQATTSADGSVKTTAVPAATTSVTSSTSVNIKVNTGIHQNLATSTMDTKNQTSFQGEYVCLPHKNTVGPQTMECDFGLKTSNGAYYALSMENSNAANKNLTTGSEIKVTGIVVPIEEISSNIWQMYNIKGIISVQSVSIV